MGEEHGCVFARRGKWYSSLTAEVEGAGVGVWMLWELKIVWVHDFELDSVRSLIPESDKLIPDRSI